MPNGGINFFRSVRAKLLLMLAALSLPLLVISLIQLNNYRTNLNEQAATIARIETAAAAGALTSWLERTPSSASGSTSLTAQETSDLYQRLREQAAPGADTVIAVFDREGRPLALPDTPTPLPKPGDKFPVANGHTAWNDGVTRMTNIRRVEPAGWQVVVGVPVAANTLAGQSLVTLAVTWALALFASILLCVWAVGRFTKPLRQLATSASALGGGELRERARVETEDEVGALAESFNVMASQLETKFKEVQTQGAFIEEVLNGLPLGVAVLDSNLIVRKVNKAFACAVGREAEMLSGRGLYEAAAGLAVLSDVVEDVRRTRQAFVTYGLPLSLVAHDHDATPETVEENFWDITIWPTSDKSFARGDLILILSEVSKRVRAEKLATNAFAAERARAAELESLINQMNEGVVIIDQHARYKVNPAAAEIIGRKRQELRDGAQAFVADIALQDLDGRVLAPEETPFLHALLNRESLSGKQFQIIRPDGERRVVAISATPLTSEDGHPQGAVAVFRDITEEVLQHDELVAAYDRLREHDRLKSAFVTNISHELRTPLNVIIGLSQLLERDKQLPLAPLQNEAVTRMERNARSLLELVNDLLDYSRLEAGRAALQLETVQVAEVIKATLEDYTREAAEKRVELRVDLSPQLGEVMTDKYKLEQVVANLVGNAIKFTSAGAVTVAAAPVDEEHWCLEVSDTGIGIERAALSYIFDEFRQVDDRLARSYGGTGLGLAITRKIVELLGGKITVQSVPQEGSRFRITWPRIIRQRTGTGSLVEKSVPKPFLSPNLRSRA
ncbi:MAG: PAS domain-containing protein [Acidobacteria bacterium]|nr:PAS domain-containing protein [Acidobacteriota bacterium]